MTDQEIIKLVLQGDHEQYAELVRRHHVHIIGLCRGILLNPTSAEDAAQDIFVKAFQLLSKFEGRSSFSTWLYRVATNHCLDLKRSIVRQRSDSLDALLEGNSEKITDPSPLPSMEKTVEMKDLAERLISGLPDTEKTALVLRESQGLTYEEIAEVLSVSIDAVKSRLRRAREKIEEKARYLLKVENV